MQLCTYHSSAADALKALSHHQHEVQWHLSYSTSPAGMCAAFIAHDAATLIRHEMPLMHCIQKPLHGAGDDSVSFLQPTEAWTQKLSFCLHFCLPTSPCKCQQRRMSMPKSMSLPLYIIPAAATIFATSLLSTSRCLQITGLPKVVRVL